MATLLWCLIILFQLSPFAICAASSEADAPIRNQQDVGLQLLSIDVPVFVKDAKTNSFHIFKYNGESPHLLKLWKTREIKIEFTDGLEPIDWKIYQHANLTQLNEIYANDNAWFGIFRRFELWRQMNLNPFTTAYVGVSASRNYKIWLKDITVDLKLATMFILGVILFFAARQLCRNVGFYYAGGMSLGLVASILLVAIILYRMVPKKSAAFTVLIGGSSLFLYAVYYVYQNVIEILMEYQKFVAIYFVTISLVSFAILYRFGPLQDQKSQNLLQWAIQFFSLLMIYYGCQIPELAALTIFAVFLIYSCNAFLSRWLQYVRYRWLWRIFPPKARLISEEEYHRQAAVETERALRQLRSFCQSPDAKPWKIASRLHDPHRFASFIEGDSHLTDDELLMHDSMDGPPDGRESDENLSDDSSDAAGRSNGGFGSYGGGGSGGGGEFSARQGSFVNPKNRSILINRSQKFSNSERFTNGAANLNRNSNGNSISSGNSHPAGNSFRSGNFSQPKIRNFSKINSNGQILDQPELSEDESD